MQLTLVSWTARQTNLPPNACHISDSLVTASSEVTPSLYNCRKLRHVHLCKGCIRLYSIILGHSPFCQSTAVILPSAWRDHMVHSCTHTCAANEVCTMLICTVIDQVTSSRGSSNVDIFQLAGSVSSISSANSDSSSMIRARSVPKL